ncbi:MAG: TRAP transporter large permease [Pseudomonadota bacterium]
MISVGVAILIGLVIVGLPIWIALTFSAIFLMHISMGMPAVSVPLAMFGSIDSFVLLAVPFFLLAGNVMAYCGPAKYIYQLVDSYVGHMKGGMAFTTVVTCMIYAAITGSTTATLAGVSALATPPMERAGYSREFVAGLLAVSSTLGQMIPPSILMVLYGALAQQNAGVLFMAGIVPGTLIGLALGITGVLLSRKQQRELQPRQDWRERGHATLKAAPAIIMPIIVLGGIYGGVFTPTEAAAVACVYGVLVSLFVYREMTWHNFYRQAVRGAVSNSSMIFLLIAAALLFSSPLAFAQLPQQIAAWTVEAELTQLQLILIVVLLWLVMGMFLDTLPIMYLTLPVVLPALQAAEVNLIYMNVVLVITMQIAQVTPPFGLSLYVASGVLNVPITRVVGASFPFLLVLLVALAVLILVPEISLFLPDLLAR